VAFTKRKHTSSSLLMARVSAERMTNHVPIVYAVTFLPGLVGFRPQCQDGPPTLAPAAYSPDSSQAGRLLFCRAFLLDTVPSTGHAVSRLSLKIRCRASRPPNRGASPVGTHAPTHR